MEFKWNYRTVLRNRGDKSLFSNATDSTQQRTQADHTSHFATTIRAHGGEVAREPDSETVLGLNWAEEYDPSHKKPIIPPRG